ncbi:hypothetical protein AMTRI_Chr04g190590 [Amborella trichopoda]
MTKQIVIIFHLPRLPKRRTRRRDDSSSHFFHPNFLSKNTLRLNSKLYPKEPNGAVCGGEPRRKPNGELSLIAKEKPIWRRMILIGRRCRPLNDFNDFCLNIERREDEAEKTWSYWRFRSNHVW